MRNERTLRRRCLAALFLLVCAVAGLFAFALSLEPEKPRAVRVFALEAVQASGEETVASVPTGEPQAPAAEGRAVGVIPSCISLTLVEDGISRGVATEASTAGELLRELGITLGAEDSVCPGLTEPLSAGAVVVVTRGVPEEIPEPASPEPLEQEAPQEAFEEEPAEITEIFTQETVVQEETVFPETEIQETFAEEMTEEPPQEDGPREALEEEPAEGEIQNGNSQDLPQADPAQFPFSNSLANSIP